MNKSFIAAIKESIVSIEKMQDQITDLQNSQAIDKSMNDLLNAQWVRLQMTWELAHRRLTELGAAN